MELKPTFFSVSGFLVPGLVGTATAATLIHANAPNRLPAAIKQLNLTPVDGAGSVIAITLATGVAAAFAFVVGATFSELFNFLGRTLVIRPLMAKSCSEYVTTLYGHQTLEAMVKANADAREVHAYLHTCGLDLHWYAGRIRMLGGTGLALGACTCLSIHLDHSWGVAIWLAVIGALCIAVALYRSMKFHMYVAATSAVVLRGGSGSAQAEAD